ncbi:MAG: hypothetical protein K2Q09_04615 [Phycisphaerales bacterium]|nr:hypothetical protein [Phycisphaerales bacterium]
MNRLVRMGIAVLAASSVGAAVATVLMARRVAAFNAGLPEQYLFKAESSRNFVAFGHPVTIEDATLAAGDPGAAPAGAAVKVTYGQSSVTIPVIAPKVKGYKDLTTYEESLRVLSFAPIREGKADIKPFSDENWRAVIIAREQRPGFDQDTWGEVRVKDWTWSLYELKPDGTITGPRTIQYRDRRGRTPAEVYAREELKKEGRPVPPLPTEPPPPWPTVQAYLTDVEPIDERSWEWQAALFTLPKMQVSRYRYRSDAVEAMGWSLTLAGFSVLGVVVGCGLVMAGRAEANREAGKTA